MKSKSLFAGLLAAATMSGMLAAPISASAQDDSHHRQQTKNTWRNVAIGGGALAALGLVEHNSTLTLAGVAGGLYAASRYEHDRKSQSHGDRDRARMYSQRYYTHNGHRYVRRTVYKNGQKYYRFERG